ncbi:hypothetical protein DBR43_30585 [Pedobacter sp. KBW06]|nr:hypothetical protein DBR43_30585 [Pedobacter sp. KBW06]
MIGGGFEKAKSNFSQLQDFNNYYFIKPIGKNKWLDRNTKSEVFISFMTEFKRHIKKELNLKRLYINQEGNPGTVKILCIFLSSIPGFNT